MLVRPKSHKMKFLAVVLLSLVAFAAGEIAEEENVLVLTTDNFEEAIEANQFMLVEFYSAECPHSQAMLQVMSEAAKRLKAQGSDIRLGAINVDNEEEFRITYEIDKYPTVLMYKGTTNEYKEYKGARNANAFVAWAKKRRFPGARAVSQVEEIDRVLQHNRNVALCFLPSPEDSSFRAFDRACKEINDTLCLVAYSPELFKHYSISDRMAVVLFKQYDNGRDELKEELSVQQIKKFIQISRMELVIEFNKDAYALIFDQDVIHDHVVLFTSFENDDKEVHVQALKEVAMAHRNEIKFLIMDIDDPANRKPLEFFNINTEEYPHLRYVDMAEEDVKKYRPQFDDFTPWGIETFIQGVKRGLIPRFRKVEELPEDWDQEDVKILTMVNYEEVTQDPTKSVFVQFAAPWCGRCGLIRTPYKKLAEHYADNPNIVIAKIDATANELPFEVTSYPSFKYYPRGSDEVLDYRGLEGTDSWINHLDNRAENMPEEKAPKDERIEL